MIERSDAVLLRRRRYFLLKACLLPGSFTVAGMLIAASGDPLGYLLAALFGVFTAAWALRLFTPPGNSTDSPRVSR